MVDFATMYNAFTDALQKGFRSSFRRTKLLSGHELEIPSGIEIKTHQPFNFVH